MLKNLLFLLLCVFLFDCKDIYNSKRSYVTPITQQNFKTQIQKIRETTNQISLVQFYKYSDGVSKDFAKDFDEFTNDYRNVFRIGACDCDAEPLICEKENIQTFPTFRIYTPIPMPTVDIEGEVSVQNIFKQASRYVRSNVIEVTSSNAETFIKESPSVPKALLFTDKKGIPLIYKALSVSFEKKLFFGLIRSEDSILVQKYKVKKFPTLIVVKANENQPKIFSGEMKFQPMFDFLNIYSEAFVPGGGSSADSAATKSWLTEVVPEMNKFSANDICLKQESVLCAILLSKGKPDPSQIEIMRNLNTIYDRKIERGAKYKFMWLDTSIETAWSKLLEAGNENKIVILNPGNRKRFTTHEGTIDVKSLQTTFERVIGGDARFVRIKDELPEFAFRKE